MITIYIVFGVIAGYFSGLLGIGAGVILMPIFIILGLPYVTAVEASLIAVFLSSLTGSIQNHRCSVMNWSPCLIICIPGSMASILGNTTLIHMISIEFLQVIYIALMFLNADLLKLAKMKKNTTSANDPNYIKDNFIQLILIGIIAGLLPSLLGMGGGIILISILIIWTKMETKEAVKCAVVTMTVTSCASLIATSMHSTLPYSIGLPAALGAIVGGFFGTLALQYVRPKMIKTSNYFISFILGFMMLSQVVLL